NALKHLLFAGCQAADELFVIFARLLLGGVVYRLLQHASDDFAKVGFVKRFFQKVDGAFFHGRHSHGHIAVARNEHHRDGRLASHQCLLQLQAGHARHTHVGNQHADDIRVVAFEEFFRAIEGYDLIAIGFEEPAQRIAHRFVIVYDIYNAAWVIHTVNSSLIGVSLGSCGAQGRVKWNRVPPSGLACAHSLPWCDSIMVRHIFRPIPSPSDLVLKNGSTSRSGSCMPCPRSVTINSTSWLCCLISTVSRSCSEWFIASRPFLTRFSSTCSIRIGSASTWGI